MQLLWAEHIQLSTQNDGAQIWREKRNIRQDHPVFNSLSWVTNVDVRLQRGTYFVTSSEVDRFCWSNH